MKSEKITELMDQIAEEKKVHAELIKDSEKKHQTDIANLNESLVKNKDELIARLKAESKKSNDQSNQTALEL